MTVAGLVSHLRWTESCWFESLVLGGSTVMPAFAEPGDANMLAAKGVPLDRLLAQYAGQCVHFNQVVAAHDLDETGRNTYYTSGESSLGWMLPHMLEETARHVGHLDTLREQLDGTKGYW